MKRLATLLATAALAAPVAACVTDDDVYDGETVKSDDGKADSSALAVFVDMEFDGTLLTDSSWNDRKTKPSSCSRSVTSTAATPSAASTAPWSRTS